VRSNPPGTCDPLDAEPIAILCAAMRPEMVSALILHNTFARYLEADDYPIVSPEALHAVIKRIATGSGNVGKWPWTRWVTANTLRRVTS
jgi:hypothetical protein